MSSIMRRRREVMDAPLRNGICCCQQLFHAFAKRCGEGSEETHITSKAADSFQSGVSLCHRHGPTGPIDCCCRADVCFTSRGGKAREALQQIALTVEFKTCRPPSGEIVGHRADHEFTSGHGWATCFSKATSTLA